MSGHSWQAVIIVKHVKKTYSLSTTKNFDDFNKTFFFLKSMLAGHHKLINAWETPHLYRGIT